MESSKIKAIAGLAAASLCVVLIGHVVSSGSSIHSGAEKPMAGIIVSFDQYCESVLNEVSGEENAAQTVEELAQQNTVPAAEQSTEVPEKTTTVTSKQTAAPTATPEQHIKLNLVYDRLGVVQVKNYLNVRKKASESSKIVGKMTNNSGCHVYTIKKGWAKIVSGNVKGWVNAKYLITDKKAEEKAQKVATRRATVTTETLNVRYLPSIDANVYDQISADEDYRVAKENISKEWLESYIKKNCKKSLLKGINLEEMYADAGNWVQVSIDNEKAFVSKDFIKLTYNLNRAVTIKETKESKSGKKGSSSGASSYSKGAAIVSYAMQFLGNRYVYGGTSLTNGTDCSGFTMRIYQHFGYSLPRVSGSQAAATRTVTPGNEQVGDLFFYGSGSVSHVALYIGNGQIIHASNPSDGIKISSAYYRKPIKIGRVM